MDPNYCFCIGEIHICCILSQKIRQIWNQTEAGLECNISLIHTYKGDAGCLNELRKK
jgi:hypothetical protein